jgi:hypothetical protein
VFAAAFFARRSEVPVAAWLTVATNAVIGGAFIGWSIADVAVQSFDTGGWARNLALAVVAFVVPPVLSAATVRGTPTPPFWRIIGPRPERTSDPLALAAGALLMAVTLLALQSALGLVFDPRYRDFPFAPLTVAAVPFLMQPITMAKRTGARAMAELAAAWLLAASIPYIAINEGFANWQSLWLCAVFAALTLILARARGAQS